MKYSYLLFVLFLFNSCYQVERNCSDFKNGTFKAKIKSTVTLIIPLFVIAFGKAEDLANAMETRGYDPYAKRSRYQKYYPKWFDYLAVIFVGTLFSIVVVLFVTNGLIPLPF